MKSNHTHEIESYHEQISNLQRNLEQKSSELSEATDTIQMLEKSNQNVEALDELRSHHTEEIESYEKQISELQNTLEAKSLELSELSERIEILSKSEAGELIRNSTMIFYEKTEALKDPDTYLAVNRLYLK